MDIKVTTNYIPEYVQVIALALKGSEIGATDAVVTDDDPVIPKELDVKISVDRVLFVLSDSSTRVCPISAHFYTIQAFF